MTTNQKKLYEAITANMNPRETLGQLCKDIGISNWVFYKIENGTWHYNSDPRYYRTLDKICKWLQRKPSEFLTP